MSKRKPTNVDLLDEADLDDIRRRLGAKNEGDTSRDEEINMMTAEELCAKKSGWELGDESWAEAYIYIYRKLVADGVKTAPLDRD